MQSRDSVPRSSLCYEKDNFLSRQNQFASLIQSLFAANVNMLQRKREKGGC
jgi:hypothetical protein